MAARRSSLMRAGIDRRAFLGAGVVLGCRRHVESFLEAGPAPPAPAPAPPPVVRSPYPLFERFPVLDKSLPRIELGRYPSAIEHAPALLDDRLYVKRDDDFTRSPSFQDGLARVYGGGKVRKLELFLGEARALGKRQLVTFGGVGSNQALAAALLGRALGFAVRRAGVVRSGQAAPRAAPRPSHDAARDRRERVPRARRGEVLRELLGGRHPTALSPPHGAFWISDRPTFLTPCRANIAATCSMRSLGIAGS